MGGGTEAYLGFAVSAAGDVNGDGIDDLLVGSFGVDGDRGEAAIIFGRQGAMDVSDTATVTVTFEGVDSAPVATDVPGNPTGTQDDQILVPVTDNDFDPEGEDLTIIDVGIQGLGGRLLELNNGELTFDPDGDYDSLAVGQSVDVIIDYTITDAFVPLASFSLDDVDGVNGSTITTTTSVNLPLLSVSSAGDVNGDGIDDFLVGAPTKANGSSLGAGSVFIIFGRQDGLPADLDLDNLQTGEGVRLVGVDGGAFIGSAVSAAGDVNGDGVDDILIGAPGTDPALSGDALLILGRRGPAPVRVELDGSYSEDFFPIFGTGGEGGIGNSLSSIGDFNGDGIDDIILGASTSTYAGYSNAGKAFIVFGDEDTIERENLDLATLQSDEGVEIAAYYTNGYLGEDVVGIGDINGDGFEDVLIGAPGYSFYDPTLLTTQNAAGIAYVVYGTNSNPGLLRSLDLASGGATLIRGLQDSDRLGSTVAGIGDINNDNVPDFAIGAPGSNPNDPGKAYVIFGDNAGIGSSVDLSQLGTGVSGFEIDGSGVGAIGLGRAISAAGDINGDGVGDLLVSAPGTNGGVGAVYVIFGRSGGGFGNTLDLSTLDGTNGFLIDGKSAGVSAGLSVSVAGDVNDDGFDDLIIGSSLDDASVADVSGAYLLFGRTAFAATVGLTDSAQATLTVTGLNDAPVAVSDFADVLSTGTVSGNVLANDVDIDNGDVLTVVDVNGSLSDVGFFAPLPSGALVQINADGSFIYDPNNAFGLLGPGNTTFDSFGYGIEDAAGAFSAATITIEVIGNFIGNLAVDDDASILTTNTLAGLNILDNDSRASTDLFVASLNGNTNDVAQTITLPSGSTLNVDADGNLIYTPGTIFSNLSGGETAQDILSYAITDGVTSYTGPVPVDRVGESLDITYTGGDFANGIGRDLSVIGDINGDGIEDFAGGAAYFYNSAQNNTTGAAYVIFGQSSRPAANGDLSNLDGSDGFIVLGETASGLLGASVSGAGDINGDGVDDLIVGSAMYGGTGVGAEQAFVILGKPSTDSFGAVLSPTNLTGADGFALNGVPGSVGASSAFGDAVSAVGDVNGDGFDDVLISAPAYANNQGAAYIVFGSSDDRPPSADIDAEVAAGRATLITGADFVALGNEVSGADVNGDGLKDIILSTNGTVAGAGVSVVIFGAAALPGQTIDPVSLDGTNGFITLTSGTSDQFGREVSFVGDVNGDGFDDVAFGAQGATSLGSAASGAVYVLFGSQAGFDPLINLSTLTGENGFVLQGFEGEGLGGVIEAAGDVNNDGIDDFLVSSGRSVNGSSGLTYVVYGQEDGFAPILYTFSLNGANGFALRNEGAAGSGDLLTGAATAGDFDNDGFTDILVANTSGGGSGEGQVYTFYGSTDLSDDDLLAEVAVNVTMPQQNAPPDALMGTAQNDTIKGTGGDDMIIGDGGSDFLSGGDGNDLLLGDGMSGMGSLAPPAPSPVNLSGADDIGAATAIFSDDRTMTSPSITPLDFDPDG